MKKGLLFAHDVVTHQLLKAPLELFLVELPFAPFETLGAVVVSVFDIGIPPVAAGLVLAYPLLVALVVAIAEHPSPRIVASYWLGTSIVTATAVVASLGMIPDPAGIGSGLTYHLVHHTVAELLRETVLGLGRGIAAAGTIVGVEIEETVGLLLALTVAAVCYGVLWERHIGHEGG